MLKVRLLYFGQIMKREESMEKMIMLGRAESSKTQCEMIDSIKKAIVFRLQDLCKDISNRAFSKTFILRAAEIRSDLMAFHTDIQLVMLARGEKQRCV